MATDKKITDLNHIQLSDLDTQNDSMVIVNTSESKKITPDELMTNRIKSLNTYNHGHIDNMVKITQGEYDALAAAGTVVATTLYVITI